jgi:hypothetical protein
MGWIPHSSVLRQVLVGSYCYVPSWPVLKTDFTQGPKRVMLICNRELSGIRRPGSLGKVDGWGKSYPPTLNRKVED